MYTLCSDCSTVVVSSALGTRRWRRLYPYARARVKHSNVLPDFSVVVESFLNCFEALVQCQRWIMLRNRNVIRSRERAFRPENHATINVLFVTGSRMNQCYMGN